MIEETEKTMADLENMRAEEVLVMLQRKVYLIKEELS